MPMIELSNERIEEILHKETGKTEELTTILRGIYTRYMRLYERYYADIDAPNDDVIAELKYYHEETQSLCKYYYMDIPLDICTGLIEFDNEYSDKLLGDDWHKFLLDSYKDFRDEHAYENKSEASLKAEFADQKLTSFYEVMDYVLRDAFNTNSKSAENVASGITSLLFGEAK